MITASLSRHYSAHRKATEEQEVPEQLEKGFAEGNVDDRLQVPLQKDGGVGSRHRAGWDGVVYGLYSTGIEKA